MCGTLDVKTHILIFSAPLAVPVSPTKQLHEHRKAFLFTIHSFNLLGQLNAVFVSIC